MGLTPEEDAARLARLLAEKARAGVLYVCTRCTTRVFIGEYHGTALCSEIIRRRRRKKISRGRRQRILSRDEYHCQRCNSTDRLEIDHVMPVFRGGLNVDDNLQVLCWRCNNRKAATCPASAR